MQTATLTGRQFLTILSSLVLFLVLMVFQSCKKEVQPSADRETAQGKKGKPQNPPPPPPPFYFTNCTDPLYTATLTKGVAANFTFTKNYINSPGGSYAAFTSATVNGITITAPAGNFNIGSGSVTFTATGTPVSSGLFTMSIGVGSMIPCTVYFTVRNAPANPATCGGDPGPAFGSTGCVTFTYRGQTVTYYTVRAKDGKIWLQQNLGSPQVAFAVWDEASFGHYFQWGRWDDGHQVPNSPTITGGPSLLNPSNIPSGNPNFIVGQTAGTRWWGSGGLATDTWSGSSATSANGKDPCVALGAGWRSPTAADWQNVKNYEDLDGSLAAYMSNLKLPAAGYRDAYGGYVYMGGESYYWTATASDNSYATSLFISDNTYLASLQASDRGSGFNCRCVKN